MIKEPAQGDIDNQHHHLIAVTDGSYYSNKNITTLAWTICNEEFDKLVINRSIVPGQSESHSSFCSKLCGMMGILDYVDTQCSFDEPERCHLTIFCDNKTAVYAMNE